MCLELTAAGLVPSEGGIQVERKRPSKASGGSQSRPACSQSRPAGKVNINTVVLFIVYGK